MSVAQPQSSHPASPPVNREITIISHSTLFYWWPVWAVGFLLGIMSIFSSWRMVTVPNGTRAMRDIEVPIVGKDGKSAMEKREILVLPEKKRLPTVDPADPNSAPLDPRLHIAKDKGLGVLFATILILVIIITNIPLRGMWSVMIIFVVIAAVIIFWLAGWWGPILRHLNYLDIRINAGGYFFISGILCVIWLLTMFLFDKRVYMVFMPGQFKVCTEVGGGEQVYSTIGMTLERQRSDLFRHWIIGMGSGDLIVKTTGAQAHQFEMANVLFIGRKVQRIEDMLKKQSVVETR